MWAFFLLPVLLVFFCDHYVLSFFFSPHVASINICYGLIDLLILHGLDIYLLGTGGWGKVTVGAEAMSSCVILSF